MKPKMVDRNGKRVKVGYKVALSARSKIHPFTIVRQSKKGNAVIKRGDYTVVIPFNQVTKLSVEELI